MIHLETPRLILRDYTLQDGELYFRLKSDPVTMYYLQDIQLHGYPDAGRELVEVLADQASPLRSRYFLHLARREDGAQVGCLGYTVTDRTPQGMLVHLGYFSYPTFWGQGYMTEAVTRLLAFAFEENDVYRVSTGCLKDNIGSERVMQHCGLIPEGEHVDAVWHDGALKTRVEYRLLRSEWKRRRAPAAMHI